MRCRDISRAIAAPTGAISEAEIEAHLATCPSCARAAEGGRRLERLWDMSRPEPPSSASWDAAWARIDRELTAAAEPIAEGSASSPSRPVVPRTLPIRMALGLVLAAAAAVLLALNLPGPAPRVAGNGPVYGTLDVQVGHTVLYHVDSDEHRVIQVSEPQALGEDELTFFSQSELGLDAVDYFALFGWFEAMPALTASARSGESASPFDPLP